MLGKAQGIVKEQGPVCIYDITSFDFCEEPEGEKKIIEGLMKHTKKWSFQLEKGAETGKLHWQGRFSLKAKIRPGGAASLFHELGWKAFHLSVTSNENRTNEFYVTKEETRIKGPWDDRNNTPIYIPRDVKNITALFYWQHQLLALSKEYDIRRLILVVDPKGGKGKTVWTRWMQCYKHGQWLPPCNDSRDIMRAVMCIKKKRPNTPNCYMVDMPRSLNKEKLGGFMTGMEMLKAGWCYDDRYQFDFDMIDPPRIIMCGNEWLDLSSLSRDRWQIFQFKFIEGFGDILEEVPLWLAKKLYKEQEERKTKGGRTEEEIQDEMMYIESQRQTNIPIPTQPPQPEAKEEKVAYGGKLKIID